MSSLGQLQEKGLAILIQNGTCKVFHSRQGLIMQTNMSGNRMFHVSATAAPKETMCLQTELETEKEVHLWHCRFGHLNHKGLTTLSQKHLVAGLPNLKMPKKTCIICLTGKQHRRSIPKKSMWRASRKLQLVHADICGPFKPSSNSNKRYILSFIDDFSRKTWVYFLHEKSEAFQNFKKKGWQY